MNAKQSVERGLRNGIPLWRIQEQLDWQENAASAPRSGFFRQVKSPAAIQRALWQPMFFLMGWVVTRVRHAMGVRWYHNHRP